MAKRHSQPTHKYPRKGKWEIVTEDELKVMETADPARYQEWDDFIYQSQLCPIRNFLPHGVINQKWGNDGLAMLNDWENNLLLYLKPNQTGGTTIGIAFLLLHGLIPANPEWPCFTEHGIIYRPWTGPKIAIVASWSWDNVVDLYNAYMKWIPRKEIPRYAPNWGCFTGETRSQLEMNFGAKVAKTQKLSCGSMIIYLCYGQRQFHWEGKQCDMAHLDEQSTEDKVDALMARQLARGPYTPIVMTLTGHILPDRPDTGSAGWIKTQMIDKGLTKGRKFKLYQNSVATTPDVIMDPAQKKAMHTQWVVEPEQTRNIKKTNEGIARYWGGWQVGGGLVFDEWNPDFHMIDPFDLTKHNPTYYRMIDHGKEPCAALLFAKMPWGDVVGFKEYYVYGKSIAENAELIVEELCGNRRKLVTEYVEEGQTFRVWEELFVKMSFEASELDAKSFGTPAQESHLTIGNLWNMAGCECAPSVGIKVQQVIPLAKEYLALSKNQKHINERIGRTFDPKLARYGAPKMYFFKGLNNTKGEIEQYVLDVNTGKPVAKNDHIVSAILFMVARDRGYRPNAAEEEPYEEPRKGEFRIPG